MNTQWIYTCLCIGSTHIDGLRFGWAQCNNIGFRFECDDGNLCTDKLVFLVHFSVHMHMDHYSFLLFSMVEVRLALRTPAVR